MKICRGSGYVTVNEFLIPNVGVSYPPRRWALYVRTRHIRIAVGACYRRYPRFEWIRQVTR